MKDNANGEKAFQLFNIHGSIQAVAEEMGCSFGEAFRLLHSEMERQQRDLEESMAPMMQDNNHLPSCPRKGCDGKIHVPKGGEQYFVCDQCQGRFVIRNTSE